MNCFMGFASLELIIEKTIKKSGVDKLINQHLCLEEV